MSYPKSFVKVCLTHSQIIKIYDFSWDGPHIVMNVMHCIHAFRNTESTLKGSQWWAESLKKTTTSHVFVFPRSEFGVSLVLPVTEYRAMTFVNTSHAFVKFWTFSTIFVWGVSLNFKGYRPSTNTGSALDRAAIQRTSVRRLMEPAICSKRY